MLNKHLPGVHNQKKHGPKITVTHYKRDLDNIQEDYDRGNYGFGFEPVKGAFKHVAQYMFDNYPDSYRLKTKAVIQCATKGFNTELSSYASSSTMSNEKSFMLDVEVSDVTDPAKAEAFARKIVSVARQAGYKRLVLSETYPMELAAELGAYHTFYHEDNVGHMLGSALLDLNEKYGVKLPEQIDYGEFLEKNGVKIEPIEGTYVKVSLKKLLELKHPLYPDLPLLVEHLANKESAYSIDLS